MPRLFGVNLVGVLLAAIAMFFVGFLFYGLLFSAVWMEARGLTADTLEQQDPAWMAGGLVIELVLAFGLAFFMKRCSISGLSHAVRFALVLAALIGFPVLAYEFVYNVIHSVPGLLVDLAHLAVSFGAGAAILSFFD